MSTARLERNTVIGLIASVVLVTAKLVAGLLGHSNALVADAIESLADTVGSVVVWLGIRVSAKPPDYDHPYGHGKAEAVATLAVSGLLLLAAIVIIVHAFWEITTPHEAPAWWTLLVLCGVVLVKEFLFRFILDSARTYDSQVAAADAWHHRSDAITSAAAFLGVSIAIAGPRLTGLKELVFADEIAAMLASGIIIRTAVTLAKPPLHELLDTAPLELIARVRQLAEQMEGVVLVEKLHARKSGSSFLVDMHVHVDPDLTVRDAHILSGKIKSQVRKAVPNVANVLIHVEPAESEGAVTPAGSINKR